MLNEENQPDLGAGSVGGAGVGSSSKLVENALATLGGGSTTADGGSVGASVATGSESVTNTVVVSTTGAAVTTGSGGAGSV